MLKLVTVLALALPFASANILAGEPCFSGTVDATTDLFTDKANITHSKKWEIEYFGTYKIVKYLGGTFGSSAESYILKQCGTELPATVIEADYNGVVTVPLAGKIGLSSTTMIPFIEALGLRSEIGAFYTPVASVSSPCVIKNVDEGNTIISTNGFSNPPIVDGIALNFVGGTGGYIANSHSQPIAVAEWDEKSLLGQAEYIKFYAAFFNMEKEANTIFAESESRLECVSAVSMKVQAVESERKTMAWGLTQGAQGDQGIWDVAICDPALEHGNYYCELATAAGINLLSVPARTGSIDFWGTPYFNNSEFEAYAKDADIFVLPDNSPTLAELIVSYPWLSEFKSVKSGEVYDHQGSGVFDWSESRPMRPSTLLADFAYIAADTGALDFEYKLEYLRKIDSTLPGNAGACLTLNDEFVVGDAFECADLGTDLIESAASSMKVQGLVAAVASVIAWITMM